MYGSLHTNVIVFSDDTDFYTNTWSWTATFPTLFATNGSLSLRGFDARMVQSQASNLGGALTPWPRPNSC